MRSRTTITTSFANVQPAPPAAVRPHRSASMALPARHRRGTLSSSGDGKVARRAEAMSARVERLLMASEAARQGRRLQEEGEQEKWVISQ